MVPNNEANQRAHILIMRKVSSISTLMDTNTATNSRAIPMKQPVMCFRAVNLGTKKELKSTDSNWANWKMRTMRLEIQFGPLKFIWFLKYSRAITKKFQGSTEPRPSNPQVIRTAWNLSGGASAEGDL